MINLRLPFDSHSGYGKIVDTLLDKLPDIYPIPLDGVPNKQKYNHYFDDRKQFDRSAPELCVCPAVNEFDFSKPMFRLKDNPKRTVLTMWESTMLSFDFVDVLNRQKQIVVPCQWNRENFNRQGVEVPICVLPLWIDDCYRPGAAAEKDIFVFGTANGDPRKRIERVVVNFKRAFPNEKDVRLYVKLGLRDKPISFLDSRIFIQQGHWKQSEMVTWYQSLDVFVSAVSAEGFGLHQLESMSCGKPIIATQYAGLKEFLNQENGYCLPYTEVPSTGYWATPGGRWSDFKDQDMIEAMRYCYQHRSEVQAKGRSAADTAKQFTLEKFIAELLLILNQ